MKVFVKLLVTVSVVAYAVWAGTVFSSNVTPKGHQFGYISPLDKLIFKEVFTKNSSFMRKQVLNVEYPPPGQPITHTINFVSVVDLHEPKGDASLIGGGIGLDRVTIHLKSARNHGFHFVVEIWGTPKRRTSQSA